MVTPTPRPGVGQSVARSANGGNPGGMAGRRPGLAPVRGVEVSSDAGSEGTKEVYVEPWDPDLAGRGFDFVTFDPAGTFP